MGRNYNSVSLYITAININLQWLNYRLNLLGCSNRVATIRKFKRKCNKCYLQIIYCHDMYAIFT